MSLKELAKQISTWREQKGFMTPSTIQNQDGDFMLGKLMLVVSEVSEASEAVRHNDLENFKEEIADTFIRLLDICGTMNIDIQKEIERKMAFNENRPIRHGKATRL